MILEGARQLDETRANLQASELKETKIKKELKKAAKKAPAEEVRELAVRWSAYLSSWTKFGSQHYIITSYETIFFVTRYIND